MEKLLLIDDFPLPPSENEMYRNVPGVGRVSAQALKDYKKAVEAWYYTHLKVVKELQNLFKNDWAGSVAYEVDTYFVFSRDRVWTLKGLPKKLDASNRVKACHDALANILGIDDKLFWAGRFEKLVGDQERVIVMIRPYVPITDKEFLDGSMPGDGASH